MPITTEHLDYGRRRAQWQRVRDAFAGEDTVKAARSTYLPVLEGQKESDESYTRYLNRAMFYPVTERTVMGLVGLMLRRQPSLQLHPAMVPHWEDLTLADDPWHMVVLETCQEMLLGGRVAIVVDWSNELRRPVWRLYPTEALTNWREGLVNGERRVTLAVFREEVPDPLNTDPFLDATITQYREFAWQDGAVVRTWRQVGDKNDWVPVEEQQLLRAGTPLPALPIVVFGPRGLYVQPDKPPLLDLVSVNFSHYRTSADYEHGLHFTALPTPYITGWTGTDQKMAIGSGVAWTIPDSAAKVGMLEFTGQGLGGVENALSKKEKLMAIIGARLLEQQPAAAETATTVRLRQSGETATLATLVEAISLGLQGAARWHAFWMQLPEDYVDVRMSKDFLDMRLTAQEVQALFATWQGGGISYGTFYWNMQQGEWAKPDVTAEEERALIDAEAELDVEEPPPAEPMPPVAAEGEDEGVEDAEAEAEEQEAS